jgi:hypothetical protein
MTEFSSHKIVIVLAPIISVFIFNVCPQGIIAQEDLVFPPGSKPYGLGYEQWGVKWWQWALSIPSERHPLDDPTGERCGESQSSPVWFLGSTFGGELLTVRTCTIPTGVAILIPPVVSECNYSEHPEYKTELELRNCAKTFQDQTTLARAAVDGKSIENLNSFRVETPLFNTTFPKNNVYGIFPRSDQEVKGETWTNQHVSDGIWVMVKPLPPGRHTIEFEGESVSQTNTWEAKVKYNLIIK